MFGNKNKNRTIGIDIGERFIKLICLDKKNDEFQLVAHGLFRTENFIELKKSLMNPELKGSSIRVNLTDPQLVVQRIELDDSVDEGADEAIKYRLENILRNPVSEYKIQYQKISDESHIYLAYAIPHQNLNQYLELLKKIGIKKYSLLEPNISAALINFKYNYQIGPSTPCALIDIGANQTSFTVMSSNGILFHMSLDQVSGSHFTNYMSQKMGTDPERAEIDKVLYKPGYFNDEAKEKEFIEVKESYYELLTEELKRALDSYSLEESRLNIKLLFFTGGGAKLYGLTDNLSSRLDMTCGLFESFRKIDCSEFGSVETLASYRDFYATAVGLAL